MGYNYENIIKSKNIEAIEYYLKESLRDVQIRRGIIRKGKSEIKQIQKSIADFEKHIEESLKNAELLKNALTQIKMEKRKIIKRIRNVYSKFMNIELFDMSDSNDYDIIWEGSLLTYEKYKEFIKNLENEFVISILDEVWNDEDDFKDLTDDKYRTFNGLGEYIYSQTIYTKVN